jgi:hypothetical protein
MPLAPTAPEELSRPARVAWLAAIVVAGTALRAYGISWGLPSFIFFDSLVHFIQPADRLLSHGDWAPQTFVHPPATTVAVAALGEAWAVIRGSAPRPADLELLGRALMTALSAVSIVVLYLLGRRLVGVRAALLASAAFALAPLHVLEAHRTHADAGMLLLAIASAHQAVVARDTGSRLRLRVAFALAGLSGGFKYTGLAVGSVPAWLALTWADASWRRRALATLEGASITALVFVLCIAPMLLVWDHFVRGVVLLGQVGLFVGQSGQNLRGEGPVYTRYVYPLVVALPYLTGWTVYLAGLVGLGLLASCRRARGPVFAAVLPFFVLQGAAETVVPRYFLPLLPYVCLGAGHALASLWRRRRSLGAVAVVLVLGYTLILTTDQCRRIDDGPSRAVAARLRSQIDALRLRQRPLALGYPHKLTLGYDPLAPFLRKARIRLVPYPKVEGRADASPASTVAAYRAWIEREKVDAVLVPSRIESAAARESGRPEASFLAALDDGRLGFRLVEDARTTFFTERLYTWADPSLSTHLTAGVIGYRLYARDAPRAPISD